MQKELTFAPPSEHSGGIFIKKMERLTIKSQIAYIAEAESAQSAPSAFSMPREYIDRFLLFGSNTENHRTRLAIEFSKQPSTERLKSFVEKTYHGGYGLQIDGTKVSAWYSEEGMRIAYGSSGR